MKKGARGSELIDTVVVIQWFGCAAREKGKDYGDAAERRYDRGDQAT